MSQVQTESPCARAIIDYEKQSEKLSLDAESTTSSGTAVEAESITTLDPVIQTADGGRLLAVPIDEAHKINLHQVQSRRSSTAVYRHLYSTQRRR